MNLKEKLQTYRGIDLKTVAYWGLPIYWLILLTGTFLHWNWRWHWVTKFAFHPTRLASTWNILRIPLSLLLAPRTVGLCACTLVLGSLRLRTLAWSLNPWLWGGTLAASSLRACKFFPVDQTFVCIWDWPGPWQLVACNFSRLLPELSVIFWVSKYH